jgi:adenylate kinase family enzyme/ribosomal protein S18 acetylase RimI-like enzyme
MSWHKNIKKIAIVGNAGSGKSTLGLELSKILGLPLYHLDQYFWLPGWQEPEREEFEKIHNELCNKDKWVIEGMAIRFFEYRIQKADCVIFLDIPTFRCLYRILKRAFVYYGKEYFSSAKGCPERGPSWKFLKFIWNFNKERKPIIEALLQQYKDTKKIFIVKNETELKELIKKFMNFIFKPLKETDLPLLFAWLSVPHVAAWWRESRDWQTFAEKYKTKFIQDKTVGAFVVNHEAKPIGYIQWATIENDPIRTEQYPERTFGIDVFIADINYIGKGYGPLLMKQFIIEKIMPQKPNKIITDPEITNVQAIRAYEKVGFKKTKIVQATDGTKLVTAQLMELEPHEIT